MPPNRQRPDQGQRNSSWETGYVMPLVSRSFEPHTGQLTTDLITLNSSQMKEALSPSPNFYTTLTGRLQTSTDVMRISVCIRRGFSRTRTRTHVSSTLVSRLRP
ncbi:hypothetical protein TNCV_4403801 [Trichonephila clavipes]|uniref:Uncharacterized protein n=1 Tax=Trichonephila clavipes TaxID=2585209 RepID=A0A8X6S6J8_TRICX|nr:hypothetical protein TNCV_4403801 [Trichonephila clavipes]